LRPCTWTAATTATSPPNLRIGLGLTDVACAKRGSKAEFKGEKPLTSVYDGRSNAPTSGSPTSASCGATPTKTLNNMSPRLLGGPAGVDRGTRPENSGHQPGPRPSHRRIDGQATSVIDVPRCARRIGRASRRRRRGPRLPTRTTAVQDRSGPPVSLLRLGILKLRMASPISRPSLPGGRTTSTNGPARAPLAVAVRSG
jgi:hypothetical protein